MNPFTLQRQISVHKILLRLSILALVLSGCKMSIGDTPPQNAGQKPGDEAPLLLASPTPLQTELPAAPPGENKSGESGEPLELIVPKSGPEPLRFTFPTAGPEAVSLWRPPLYPVPWEPTPQDHFYFKRPIGANEVNWPLARYRYGGVFFEDTVHSGVDIPAPMGTPVLAAGPGKVIWAGYGLFFLQQKFQDPYGLAIAIQHDFGYLGEPIYTVYAHMDEIVAFQGQRVETGQQIGMVGETGHATGPHLHFEIRLNDNKAYSTRNPELWLSPPQGWGVMAGRVMGHTGGPLYKYQVTLRNQDTGQTWTVNTYGKGTVNTDTYYKENMVIGDLPAGPYSVIIEYDSVTYRAQVEIQPGKVSYFKFRGKLGFDTELPPTPRPQFTPPAAKSTTMP